MSERYALFIYDESCIAAQPWLEAGYVCICVDLQHPRGETREGNLIRVGCDVRNYIPPSKQFAICGVFTPCTDMAVSGARWFKDKGLRAIIDALELAERGRVIAEATGAPWFLENPVSTLASYWRKPDHTFDPCDFAGYLEDPSAEAYTKKTCLWTGGGFVMPDTRRVEPILGSKMHLLPPSEDRATIRSKTPAGFSRAVFEANHTQEGIMI